MKKIALLFLLIASQAYAAIDIANNNNLKLYGIVTETTLFANDGYTDNTFFTSNDIYYTRFGVIADTTAYNTDFGGNIEFAPKVNPSSIVSQQTPTVTNPISVTIAEIFAKSEKYGSIYLGKGKTATFNAVEVDLSDAGVRSALEADLGQLGGGMYFRSIGNATDFVSNNQVFNNFNELNGHLASRIMYTTPVYYGFNLAASASDSQSTEGALWYSNTFKYFKAAGAIGYNSPEALNDVLGRWLIGSFSLLFNNGIFATVATGKIFVRNNPVRQDPHYHYAKLGYQTRLNQFGLTSIGADFSQTYDYAMNGDRGKSYAAAIAQSFDKINLSVYAGDRVFTLNRIGTNFSNINTVIVGALFSF